MTKELRDALKSCCARAETEHERLEAHDQAIAAILDCTESLHASIKRTDENTAYIRKQFEIKQAREEGKRAGAAAVLSLLKVVGGFGGGVAAVKVLELFT